MVEQQARLIRGRFVLRAWQTRDGSPYLYAHIRDTETLQVHRFSTRRVKPSDAACVVEEWLDNYLARERGEVPTDAREASLADVWARWQATKVVKPITRYAYDREFDAHIGPAIGHMALPDVERADIQALMAELANVCKLAPLTRKKILRHLAGFFRWCADEGLVLRSPCRGIRIPGGRKTTPRALTPEEARRLLDACSGAQIVTRTGSRQPRDLHAAVTLALLTGIRRRSLASLRWRQVDLPKRRIILPPEAVKVEREHMVPIGEELHGYMARLARDLGRIEPDAQVAPPPRCDPHFHVAVARADLPKMRWHDLRHCYATWLAEKEPKAVVAACLGHAPEDVTDIYTHIPFTRRLEAADRLPRILSTPAPAGETRQSAGS